MHLDFANDIYDGLTHVFSTYSSMFFLCVRPVFVIDPTQKSAQGISSLSVSKLCHPLLLVDTNLSAICLCYLPDALHLFLPLNLCMQKSDLHNDVQLSQHAHQLLWLWLPQASTYSEMSNSMHSGSYLLIAVYPTLF